MSVNAGFKALKDGYNNLRRFSNTALVMYTDAQPLPPAAPYKACFGRRPHTYPKSFPVLKFFIYLSRSVKDSACLVDSCAIWRAYIPN